VRESLAAANSVTRIGIQDTNAWEKPIRYVADDNQGNVGIIEFQANRAVAAISARARGRALDLARALSLAPVEQRDDLLRVCELPLLQEGLGISEVFWTVGEFLHGPEDWDEMCLHGAELFEREALSDPEWEEIGIPYYNLTIAAARAVISIAARAQVRVPLVRLSEDELGLLVPEGSKYENTARGLLLSDGLFELMTAASE
jgi:hypothetical protein